MIGFKKLINAKALYQTQDKIWVAKGMKFFAVDYTGKRVSRVFKVGGLKDGYGLGLSCLHKSTP